MPLLSLTAMFCVSCSSGHSNLDVFKLPQNEAEYLALKAFAHKIIPEDQWQNLCDAPREDIEARITLIGYAENWTQAKLDEIRLQEHERIYSVQRKYAPKPNFIASELKTDEVRGQAIRELEGYDQFWASAAFRYPEFTRPSSEINHKVFSPLFNRGQCEEQNDVLKMLKPILKTSEFPTDKRFGEGTLRSLFYITQHADEDVDFQVMMLEEFEQRPGSIESTLLALLTDRVKLNQGKLQIYGSQLECRDGEYHPRPVENPEMLDERRTSVGLEPFADYAAGTPGCGNGTSF